MKKNIIILFSLFIILNTLYISVNAQEASPSSIRDNVKKQVDAEIAQIKKTAVKKAFLGSITSKSDATVTLLSLRALPRNITITPETVIKLLGGREGTIKDLKPGDYVLAMGEADAQNNLTTKRLLVVGKPEDDKRQVVTGTVTAFTSKTLSLNTAKNESWILNISSSTKFGPDSYKFKDIDPDFKIIAVGRPAATVNTLTVSRIFVTFAPTPTPKP